MEEEGDLWSCLDRCRVIFFSLMIGSAEKFFPLYLTQGGCPNKEDISGVSGEGLGKKRRKNACSLEQSKKSGVKKALEK